MPQVSNIAQSILSELDRARGTRISLTLDIDAKSADGFPEHVELRVRQSSETARASQRAVWFPEPTLEMCFRSNRYDQGITLLQFEDEGHRYQEKEAIGDVLDHFVQSGQMPRH